MTNVILQPFGLDLVNVNVYAIFYIYVYILNGSRIMGIFANWPGIHNFTNWPGTDTQGDYRAHSESQPSASLLVKRTTGEYNTIASAIGAATVNYIGHCSGQSVC